MEKKKSNLKSICCGAKVRIEGMDDFDKQCTMYHICTKCNQACDVLINIRKKWNINPVTQVKGDEREKKRQKEIKKEIKENL
jgi:hypothetical protein